MSYLQLARESLEVMRSQPEAPNHPPAVEAEMTSMTETSKAGFAVMTLTEFSTSGLILRVRSEVLGCTVFFVADNAPRSMVKRLNQPVYKVAELRKLALLRPSPRGLQTLHNVKTIFCGEISDVEAE